MTCEPLAGNLLGNPGFEDPSASEVDGNGRANNRGNPKSTIPGNTLGPWDGCCNQATGGTTWTVSTAMPHCGTRVVAIASDQASGNVLNQRLDLAAYGGRAFRATAWVFVSQALGGGQVALDVFDLTASQIVATSPALTASTADWRLLTVAGTVPTGGSLQLRCNSSGTVSAMLDDTALVIQ
jgi:hypothetical protein